MATYAAYRHVELDNVGYGKKRVLKPPGGGSSDIFGAGSEVSSPRRVKQHSQSTLGSGFFGNGEQVHHQQQPASNGSSAPETPRSKPGNDSYKRLFGPPDAPPPSTPNSKYHMRSNIALSADSTEPNSPTRHGELGSNGSINGHLANGNGYHHNDVVDGNPVTGAGYEGSSIQQNGNANGAGSGGASSVGSDKSSTDSSPSAAGGVTRMKNRVPPGGFSSGLW